jgi:hypothetical protein
MNFILRQRRATSLPLATLIGAEGDCALVGSPYRVKITDNLHKV